MDIRAVIAGVWRWIGHFSLAVWLWAAGLGALVAVGIGAALFCWDILPIGLRITLLIGIAACVGAMWLDAMPTLKQTVRARSSRAETREEKFSLDLAKKNYSVGGQRIPGDRFFLDEAISFREVKSEQSFAYDLMIRVRNNFQPTRTALTQEESEWIFDKEPSYAHSRQGD
jgi:hypothetical protein